jgi:hypothetical protein
MQPLIGWLWAVLDSTRYSNRGDVYAEAIALRLRIEVGEDFAKATYIVQAAKRDEDRFLDVLDMALRAADYQQVGNLKTALALGGSVWDVADDGKSLVRRVSEAEQEAYERTVSLADEIANELRTAWAATYGRHPNASDAWDHAIKAVEAALWPIVTPNSHKANLGTIASHLGKQAEQFTLRLATSSDRATNVETLAQMLRLMWPNPDRHATGSRRTPTQEEAQNVVHLAVLIVNWIRSDPLTTAQPPAPERPLM